MLGIIFDCDGTLVDTEPLHFLSWKKALAIRGRTFTLEECAQLSGLSGIDFAARLDPENPSALLQDKRKFYYEKQKKGVPPIKRMVDFVLELHEKKEDLKFRMAVASAAQKEEIMTNLESVGLRNVFSVILSGHCDLLHIKDPEGVNKPKPYIYQHAAKLLGYQPSQCVAFEDTSTGILAAKNAGMFTFAVPNEITKTQDFSHAHCIIENHEKLNVDYLLTKIQK